MLPSGASYIHLNNNNNNYISALDEMEQNQKTRWGPRLFVLVVPIFYYYRTGTHLSVTHLTTLNRANSKGALLIYDPRHQVFLAARCFFFLAHSFLLFALALISCAKTSSSAPQTTLLWPGTRREKTSMASSSWKKDFLYFFFLKPTSKRNHNRRTHLFH